MRTLSGWPPDSTSNAGAVSSIPTASSTFWPTPIVGSFALITFSTSMLIAVGSRWMTSINSNSSTEPDTSAFANGGVFLHTGSWLTPFARMISMASRTGWLGLTYSRFSIDAFRVSSTAPTHWSHSCRNPKFIIQSSLKTVER